MVLEIHQQQDFERLLDKSKSDPVLIFKHSTQCPISAHAYNEFRNFAESTPTITCGVVLVIEDRTVSSLIASRLGVRHESPQAILIRDCKAEWNSSHWRVTAEALSAAIAAAPPLLK
jgi:bacillithiol system protein YtxJ